MRIGIWFGVACVLSCCGVVRADALDDLRDGHARQAAGTPLGGAFASAGGPRAAVVMPADHAASADWLFDQPTGATVRVNAGPDAAEAAARAVRDHDLKAVLVVAADEPSAWLQVENVLAADADLLAAAVAGKIEVEAAVLDAAGRFRWLGPHPDVPQPPVDMHPATVLPEAVVTVVEPALPEPVEIESSAPLWPLALLPAAAAAFAWHRRPRPAAPAIEEWPDDESVRAAVERLRDGLRGRPVGPATC